MILKLKIQQKLRGKRKAITYLFLCIVITSALFSCKQKSKEKQYTKTNNGINAWIMDEKILKEQLEFGAKQYFDEAGVEIPAPPFAEKDLDQTILIVSKLLTNNGYKKTNNEEFTNKIKKIFGRTLDITSANKIAYVNFLNNCKKEIIYFPNNGIDYCGLYIIKNEKFISNFYYIPQLLDYQKLYPNLFENEKMGRSKYLDKDGDKITIEKWMNYPNLKHEREKNILTIVNRNKYLFNDDKASFAWLKFNDDKFLNDLVKIFGYVKDEKLLSFVLSKNINDEQEFCKILWNHKCDGKAIFHQEVFNLIKTYDEKKRHDFLDNLSLKIINLKKIITENPEITFSQKAELLGKIAYNAEKLAQLDNYQTYQFFKTLNEDVFQKEFEKQNYYNIQDFKEVYDEAKTGGINFAE